MQCIQQYFFDAIGGIIETIKWNISQSVRFATTRSVKGCEVNWI